MFPEIWSTTDRIFGHSGLFFALLPPIDPENMKLWKNEEKKRRRYYHFTHVYHNDNHMMKDSWDMECDRQNFLSFWTIFCPFTPPPLTTQKIKILKNEKKPGDIIMLHVSTKNNDHMIYGSWNMVHKGQTGMWTDRHTDRKTDKHINVGAPPNNNRQN